QLAFFGEQASIANNKFRLLLFVAHNPHSVTAGACCGKGWAIALKGNELSCTGSDAILSSASAASRRTYPSPTFSGPCGSGSRATLVISATPRPPASTFVPAAGNAPWNR